MPNEGTVTLIIQFLTFKGEAILSVGKVGHELDRTAEAALLGHLPRGGHHLCRLVPLHSHRSNGRRNQDGRSGGEIITCFYSIKFILVIENNVITIASCGC